MAAGLAAGVGYRGVAAVAAGVDDRGERDRDRLASPGTLISTACRWRAARRWLFAGSAAGSSKTPLGRPRGCGISRSPILKRASPLAPLRRARRATLYVE